MKRASIQRLRHGVQIAVYLLIFLHLYLYYGCGNHSVGSVGFEEFFRAFLQRGVFNAGALLVSITLLLTLLLGRVFCGWACHFGALQELCHAMLKRAGLKPKMIDAPLMKLVPVLALGIYFLWPTLSVWGGAGLPTPSFNLGFTSIWEVLPGPVVATATLVVNGCLLVVFFGTRGFCRLLCPWGALLKPVNFLSRRSVQLVGECTGCRTCVEHCQMGIDVQKYTKREGRVSASECIKCLSCVSACPEGVLALRRETGLALRNIGTEHQARHRLARREQLVLLAASLLTLVMISDLATISPLLALAVGALAGLAIITVQRRRKQRQRERGARRSQTDARWEPARYALLLAVTTALVAGILLSGTYKAAKGLATHYVQRDNLTAALPSMRLASFLAPQNGNLWSAQAMIHLRLGDTERASDLASRAVRINANDLQAHRVLATHHHRAGNTRSAIEGYRHMLRIAPRDTEARMALCQAYADLGRAAEAKACIAEGLRAGTISVRRPNSRE